jgi:hypothetical protein
LLARIGTIRSWSSDFRVIDLNAHFEVFESS